jgi:hypothetical protein
MSLEDALERAEADRNASLAMKIWQKVPRLGGERRTASRPTPVVLPPHDPDAGLRALRSAIERLDDRLSHEMTEREGKLITEMQQAMGRLETELSERFAASVLENRRTLRRSFAGFAFLIACVAGLLVVAIEYL